ncbi:hypothetical protein Pmani_016787 [Petrolisthes manimaculis]|uniref:Uncharacterized protein n=1 Tax=Petrolisthes manimaculis TaxID=1843537 RepID=A0AAE1PNI2_9EUCA|nr:hypothetical protein Pmani_016787 [Petrolisthes manimaculis]
MGYLAPNLNPVDLEWSARPRQQVPPPALPATTHTTLNKNNNPYTTHQHPCDVAVCEDHVSTEELWSCHLLRIPPSPRWSLEEPCGCTVRQSS